MIKKIVIGFSICFLATLVLGAFYWWFTLPFHELPIEQHSTADTQGSEHQLIFKDVSYASQSRFQKLDLYLPKSGEGPFPLVIWIHGGGLIMGDKSSMPQTDFGPPPIPTGPYGPYQVQVPDVAALHAKGFAVASLNYRLGAHPVTAAKSAIKDAKAAVRFLRANAQDYNLDPTRFAVWGNSMGGYLAAMLGVTGDRHTDFDDPDLFELGTSSSVQAVVVWYGAEDRMPKNLDLYYQISQSKNLPPFLIVNGTEDLVITPEQANRLHQALKKAGSESQLTIVPGAGHEDPLFRKNQMLPAMEFIYRSFSHQQKL